jgi:hypothetical protein
MEYEITVPLHNIVYVWDTRQYGEHIMLFRHTITGNVKKFRLGAIHFCSPLARTKIKEEKVKSA